MSNKVVSENVVKNIVPATTVPCQTLTRIKKSVDYYGFITVEESDIRIKQAFTAFIATADEPQNYTQIFWSPD